MTEPGETYQDFASRMDALLTRECRCSRRCGSVHMELADESGGGYASRCVAESMIQDFPGVWKPL